MIKKCLIGYTGTVGKNLLEQTFFSEFYNSSNIEEIKNKSFDELYLSCLPATKWQINQNPQSDDYNTKYIIDILKTVKSKFTVLISTIDVYSIKNNLADENYNIEDDIKKNICDTYGKNRFVFEKFIMENFDNYMIVRLPGVFGNYLKKNILYDLLNNNNINQINKNSSFQWYFLDDLYDDIQNFKNKKIKIVNLFTEPIKTEEIIHMFFQDKINLAVNNNKPVEYDLCTIYGKYLYSKEQILNKIKIYIDRTKTNKYIGFVDPENIIFSNLAWNSLENQQIIEIFKNNNIKNVELALTKFFNWNEITEEKLKEIKNTFNKNQIRIYSLQSITFGLDYNLFSDTSDLLLAHLRNVIQYAKILGAKRIVFGSPKNRSYNENNYDEQKAMNFFTELNETAKEKNIIFCIEPNAKIYNCNFLWNTTQTYEFVKKLNCSHIKMMADIGCMILENDDIYNIYKYKKYIEHIHISEPYLKPLTNDYIEHEELCEILMDSNKTYFTIEIKAEETENIKQISKTIDFIKNNYKKLLRTRNI